MSTVQGVMMRHSSTEVGAHLGEDVGGRGKHREAGLVAAQLIRDLGLCGMAGGEVVGVCVLAGAAQ
jgi:hypothetical protein